VDAGGTKAPGTGGFASTEALGAVRNDAVVDGCQNGTKSEGAIGKMELSVIDARTREIVSH